MGLKSRWFRRRPSDDEMREELEAHVAIPVIVSGAIRSAADVLAAAAFRSRGIAGAIVGRALYEQRFTVGEGQAALDG